MTTLNCAISGVQIQVPYFAGVNISYYCGYYHPIFAAPESTINSLLSQYLHNQLEPTESYLLFLAIANNSGLIIWNYPLDCSIYKPTNYQTQKLIANKISKLIEALTKSAELSRQRSDFDQPKLVISATNNNLRSIADYITVLQNNIDEYLHFKQDQFLLEQLRKAENKLTLAIKSSASTSDYPHLVANWACLAGEFPADKAADYKKVITDAFNSHKMFQTPLELIKETKTFCENNIEAGSIHFHALHKTLTAAITNHIDYLGASFGTTYTLESFDSIDAAASADSAAKSKHVLSTLANLKSNAPTREPVKSDYSTLSDFIKAKLAYQLNKTSGVYNDD